MKGICHLLFASFSLASFSTVGASDKISLSTSPELTQADIYVETCQDLARGILVLCPGRNGNGGELIDNPRWIDFAKKQKLNLVGLSFASNIESQDRGYFVASGGSGQVLLDGLSQAFGPKQSPLLFYGFSRGAQFAYSFACWKPRMVAAWCAYSATEWESPGAGCRGPKGIIACGDEDESNYSYSVLQFLKGRSLAKPWTWISLAHVGHAWSPALEDFVRAYFASVLDKPNNGGLWLDVDTKAQVSAGELKDHPTLAAWLPDENVARAWKDLHQP